MPSARFCFPHHGNRTLDFYLFDEVENAGELRDRLVGGEDVGCAILGAATVAGTAHLLLAANKALARDGDGTRKVKGLHADLVFALAASKHIGEALRHFGIPLTTTPCRLCVAVFDADESTPAAIRELVSGNEACDPLGLMEGGTWTDWDALRNLFRIGALEEEASPGGLIGAVLNRVGTSEK